MFFISTKTVEDAFYKFVKQRDNLSNCSVLQCFFILKASGCSQKDHLPFKQIEEAAYEPAWHLCSLFNELETTRLKDPKKSYDHTSPFTMPDMKAAESLKKWVGGRLKNNVVGGSTMVSFARSCSKGKRNKCR